MQTEENLAADEFQTEETHVEVHTEETETAADKFRTEEAHVQVHIQTEETQTETDVNIQTEETVVEVETGKIESPVKKTKMISELVCVVETKTRSAKAKKGTRCGRKR